jgi:GT2 family glycosyltransferase
MYMKPSRTGGFDAAADFGLSAQPMVSSSGNESDTPSPRRQVRRLIRTLLRIWGLSYIGDATMGKGFTGHHAKYERLHPIVIFLDRVCHLIDDYLIIPFELPTKCIRQQFAGQTSAEIILSVGYDPLEFRRGGEMESSRQFAGGMNAGAAYALARGATRLLFLNNDTVLEPDALACLEDALAGAPGAGIAGPRVVDLADTSRVITAGERHALPLLCVPRTLLRYRGPLDRPYPVQGVMGCALLVTKPCFEAVGGFPTDIEVYYEDVDFCLGARAAGFTAIVEPRAVVAHDGIRGFAAGLTPWAGFLKARNPWLLVRRRGGAATWLVFVPTYAAMVATSALLYALRGRFDVVRALARGALAGLRVALGGAPVPAGAPRAAG